MPHHRTAAAIISVSLALVALTACSSHSHQTAPPTSSQIERAHNRPQHSRLRPPQHAQPNNNHHRSRTYRLHSVHLSRCSARPRPPWPAPIPPDNTVNLITVLKTLATYRDWVWSHPNPALVANYELPNGNRLCRRGRDLWPYSSAMASTPIRPRVRSCTSESRYQRHLNRSVANTSNSATTKTSMAEPL